jgi:PAS domain-containing protein
VLKIKIIKGANIGKSFDLTPGDHVVGRAPQCDIVISSSGVSKMHARFSVQSSQCLVTDLDSSNGTFVNGVKVHDRILRPGDRIGFHDVIVELSLGQNEDRSINIPPIAPPPRPGWNGNVAYTQAPGPLPIQTPGLMGPDLQAGMQNQSQTAPTTFVDLIQSYVDKIVLPGVYRLAEIYPLSHVLAAFVALFVLMVTALATIPMAALTHEGVQKEAQRRALTIGRQLAATSEKLIASGAEGNIRTDLAESEDGVLSALVISQDDGHIIAPLSKAQSYSNDQFAAVARKHENEPFFISELGNSTIGVSVPIHGYSQEMGQQLTVAESVILYKMDSQDWSATVGLFARILIIALVLGGLLYFFLYRLITFPITDATGQLDEALRGGRDTINTKFDFDVFKKFLENINSAIGRMGKSQEMAQLNANIDRSAEASNLVRIISDPAFALDASGRFIQINSAFEELIGMRLLTLQGQGFEVLQDQALKLTFEELFRNAKSAPGTIVSNQLDISGLVFEIDMQVSPDGEDATKVSYVMATLKKRGGV